MISVATRAVPRAVAIHDYDSTADELKQGHEVSLKAGDTCVRAHPPQELLYVQLRSIRL